MSEVARWNLETLAIEVLVVSQKSLLPTFFSMGAVSQPELCKYNIFSTLLMRVYKELLLKLRAFSKCGGCFQRLRQGISFTIMIMIYAQQDFLKQ